MQEFKLPDLGEGMQEAEIRRWLVKPGDTVKLDQPMVEVETDKAVVEIPSPLTGTVAALRVQEGAVAKLGEVIVTFGEAAGTTSAPAAPVQAAESRVDGVKSDEARLPEKVLDASASQQHAVADTAPVARQRVLAAPAVRKRAFEFGIDLAQVTPSQPNGRVTMDDVLSFVKHGNANGHAVATATAEKPDAAPPSSTMTSATATAPAPVVQQAPAGEDERHALTGLRRRIAERMEHAWRTIPHATAFDELDGTELGELRRILKPMAEQRSARLTYMPILVKLLLPALRDFPMFNAHFDEAGRAVVYKRVYHVGIATDSPEGLLVPVLRDAQQYTLLQVAQQLEQLVEGAQKRTLTPAQVSGSTFTLNNIGSFGGGSGTPIINAPEVAILAVGKLQEKAVVRNGSLVARTMMPLALSFDHRVIDGALAGRFLARFKELVEQPQQLLLDML